MSSSQNPPLLSRTATLVAVVALLIVCIGSVSLGLILFNQLRPAGVSQPIDLDVYSQSGLLVTAVSPNGPAAQAGLRRGDILLRAADRPLQTPQELRQLLQGIEPGSDLTLTVQRGDKSAEFTLTVATAPQPLGMAVLASGPLPEQGNPPPRQDDVAEQLPVISRVLPETAAQAAGLQPDDLILAVDGQALRTAGQLAAVIEQRRPGDQVTIVIRRQDETLVLSATLGSNPADAERAFLGIELVPPTR